jgi:hypothetical protein
MIVMAIALGLSANAFAGLTNHWPMDDNDSGSVVADVVGSSPLTFTHTVQPTTMAQHSANSQQGTGSLLFDNDVSGKSASGDFGLKAAGAGYSYAFWFNPTSGYDASTNNNFFLENNGGGASSNPRTTSGWFNKVVGGRISHTENNSLDINSTSDTWAANNWYHLAITIQADAGSLLAGTASIYVNGSLDNQNTGATLTNGTHEVIWVGGHPNVGEVTTPSCDCLLDDFRWYDHALTPTEVTNIVPEPATLGLLAVGGLALVSRRRR